MQSLAARPEAAICCAEAPGARPRATRSNALQLIIDEKTNEAFGADHYRHLFAVIRDVAVHGLVEAANGDKVVLMPARAARPIRHDLPGVRGLKDGEAEAFGNLPRLVEPMPSLTGFRDQDLRDTAVTWLALAGCTVPEIAVVTGHSLQSITSVLEHYLARHPELADHAIAKLVEWHG